MLPSELIVYWAYDADGQLLYVGRTQDWASRERDHRRRSSWFRLVARWEFQHFSDMREWMDAEHDAIKAGQPIWNIQVTNRRWTPSHPGSADERTGRADESRTE